MIDEFSTPRPRRRDGPFLLPAGVTPPPFCPRCGAVGLAGERLCPECGEAVAEQGYCATCEGFWRRAIATPCPKHDIPLDLAPPPLEFPGDAGLPGERWVTVAVYNHPNEANPPRIRLEAEGIATFLDGERVAGSTLYQVATGGAKLQVPESLSAAARVILAQTWTARLDPPTVAAARPDPDEDDEDDPWAGLAPAPGDRRRAIMRVAILVFLIGPALITVGQSLARLFGLFP